MLKEFKEFISRGNVLDLAVGVIIGGAFTSIVTSITNNVFTPLIGLVVSFIFPGKSDVDDVTSGLAFKINNVTFNYGMVISAVITFFITAFVLFAIVKAFNQANKVVPTIVEEEEPETPETSEDILNDIRQLLVEQNKPKEEDVVIKVDEEKME